MTTNYKNTRHIVSPRIRNTRGFLYAGYWFPALLIATVLTCPTGGRAQVATNITSSGLDTALNGGASCFGGQCNITGGTPRGSNLFHSFGVFNVGAGDAANFNNVEGRAINNILGRVTGGLTSNIFGTIQTTDFGAANLYLINPAGWIFGPSASLNVGGSFHVSTADYIRLGDGVQFNATPGPADALLTSAPPAAFGFLGPTAASISVDGSFLNVPEGQTLSLVGGDVQIAGATLSAPSGRVQIASVASAGEVTIPDLGVGSFSSLGQINVSANSDGVPSALDTSADAGGTVIIRGGRLVVTDGSVIQSNTGDTNGAPLAVDLQVSDEIQMDSFSNVLALGFGAGDTGDIRIATNHLQMQGASGVVTQSNGTGRPGAIDIDVKSLTLTDNAVILSQTFGGAAKDLKVKADDSILISSAGSVSSHTFAVVPEGTGANAFVSAPILAVTSGGKIEAVSFDIAAGGNIEARAENLTLTGGGNITSQTAVAAGGDVFVTASKSAMISGAGSGIFSIGSGGSETAPTGNIELNVGQLTVSQSGAIQNGDLFSRGGSITIASTDSIVVSDKGKIISQAFRQDVGSVVISGATLAIDNGLIQTSTTEAGRAGDATVTVGNLSLLNGGQIVTSSEASASGRGGDLTVTATSSISISGQSPDGQPVSSLSNNTRSGLFSTAASIGDAGQISVATPTLTMRDRGTISVVTSGVGNAGNIALNVNSFTQTNGARVESSTDGAGAGGALGLTARDLVSISGAGSGLFSTASSTGNAGQIMVAAPGSAPVPTLTMAEGGKISVATSGAGNAGSVTLSANNFSLTDGAQIESSTTGAGQGGSVAVTAIDSISISGTGSGASGLFSTASSTGNAGQVSVTTPTLAMGDGGTISVVTSGAGNAGNIALNVNTFTQTNGARVESSTDGGGAGGTLELTARDLVSISGAGSGLFSTASGTGDAGQITVSAAGSAPVPSLTIADGAKISVATSGAGNAGSVSLNANTLNLTGAAQVVSSTDGAGQGGSVAIAANNSTSISGSGGGLFSTASNTGNAGQITLTTPTLTMGDSGTISVATSGAGNAGNASLNVNNFTQTGGATVDSSTTSGGHGGNLTVTAANSATISDPGSGLSSTASGTGAGGNIGLQAENIQLLNGGTITTNSTGTATASAGDVNIVFGDTLRILDGSITTAATLADGGNISITATGSMLQMTNANIITSVASGFGTGGNITIGSTGHPFDFVVLNDSQIRADAFGGPGGNININADVYLTSNSVVSASSQLSSPGIIAIEASFTDVSGSVAQLPETPLKATDLLRASCAARFAGGKMSSLVLSGRDGLPIQPGGVLPSPLYLASNAAAPTAGGGSLTQGSTARFSLLSAGSNDRPLTQYSLLPNAKCAF